MATNWRLWWGRPTPPPHQGVSKGDRVVVAKIMQIQASTGGRHFVTDDQRWEIPEAIWQQSGIARWTRTKSRYRLDGHAWKSRDDWPREICSLTDIEVHFRPPIDDRFLQILNGFATNAAIPAIWVVRNDRDRFGKRFILSNGFHRYHSSMAVGFTEIGIRILSPEDSGGMSRWGGP